ncbi:hypothetical protein SASPL_138639 [Salvia splendens]|uniref:Lon N-terminal domain-containing protein n=1 Tax=Salvia splendens TaxID=180675 RepID=A0A8X8ZF86_SALSN|nr:hypothetical protein SASPL_138639 [Salvia splendens]
MEWGGIINLMGAVQHLYDLMHRGNKAFREDRLDQALVNWYAFLDNTHELAVKLYQAIELYSRANHIKPGDSIILSNRCAGLSPVCGLAIPQKQAPSASEHRHTEWLDPTTHAGLALNDAESWKSMSWLKMLFGQGLQIDPQSNALANLEKKITNTFVRRSHVILNEQMIMIALYVIDVLCVVLFCLLAPGHVQSVSQLNNIIEKSFPEEYAERKLEQLSLTNPGPDLLPLFAMDVILPCQKLQLNIFEPRYRLMVVIDPSTGSVVDYACELRASSRWTFLFRGEKVGGDVVSLEIGDQDGYRVAEVEWVNDISPPEGSERNDLLEMTHNASVFARQWIKEAQEAAQGDRIRLAELFKVEGLMPPTRDPEHFSFWLATLTNRRPSERLELLRLRDTRERITRSLLFMKAEEQGCRLQ